MTGSRRFPHSSPCHPERSRASARRRGPHRQVFVCGVQSRGICGCSSHAAISLALPRHALGEITSATSTLHSKKSCHPERRTPGALIARQRNWGQRREGSASILVIARRALEEITSATSTLHSKKSCHPERRTPGALIARQRNWGQRRERSASAFLFPIPYSLFPAFLFLSSFAHAQQPAVTLTPALVEAGSPELLRITAPDVTSIDGEWLGRKIQFFPAPDHRAWLALAGVDVEAATGPSTLTLHLHTAGNATRDLTQSIEIHPAHYRTGTLSVSPKFVTPGPDELKQIQADSKVKEQVFSTSATEPLWSGTFRAPVLAQPTDSFGTRRTFNGKLASVHKGMDFRAPMGTIVRAANSGTIVLARPLYYEGNCVVIDHGLGLYTLSMHFSRIDVHEGQHVNTGDPLGLSGATGRVTGPHLHWAVRWQGAYLDPAKLLHLTLPTNP
jgi:hypothetical protein